MKTHISCCDPYIENQHCLQINRLPARATVIPAKKRGVYYRNKEESELLGSLNGDWQFLYLPQGDDGEDYSAPALEDGGWDVIDVPSMWQYRGYGKCEYPNVCYPFAFVPPMIKKTNPVGWYRRRFTVAKPAGKTILHFSGVDNAFFVYLNGERIGFSKGSRLPAEFDLTPYLRAGENLLAVKVYTYSDASYLENQDMLLAGGIFRDVYLLESDASTLWDYRVTTTLHSVSVEAEIEGGEGCEVTLSLDGREVTLPAAGRVKHCFELEAPRLWTAETPELYDLCLELKRDGELLESHSKKIGLMECRVVGRELQVNGKPITVKGVNRHENHPFNGRTLTVEEIERDLKMIKANHLNAVRLSHYTNHPATYEIASLLGLYLMDEADLETHGAGATGDQGALSKDPDWYEAYEDRVLRMLEVNKNETCVFIRTTGNECGTGENLDKCYDLIVNFHKDSVALRNQGGGGKDPIRLIGYYTMESVRDLPDEGKPVLAIEYAHAMGNSPGTLEDYWDYNYTHPQVVGGFVWEFRSHGFGAVDGEGKVYYRYGGDFDDSYHWANFILDGFLRSDSTPKPAWRELGAVSFPVYTRFDGERLIVKNTNDFTRLPYTAALVLTEDGKEKQSLAVELGDLLPHGEKTIPRLPLPACYQGGARYHLELRCYSDGACVHRKQFSLPNPASALPDCPPPCTAKLRREGKRLRVEGEGYTFGFEENGMLSFWEVDGKTLLKEPMAFSFYRAHIDNDGIEGLFPRRCEEWGKIKPWDWFLHTQEIAAEELADRFRIEVSGFVTATAGRCAGFAVKLSYEITEGGRCAVSLQGEPYGRLPAVLPRIGLMLPLAKDFDRCRWLGRGPGESYADCKCASPVGDWSSSVEGLNFLYDFPQETGNHENCVLVEMSGAEAVFSAVASGEMAFSCHPFSLKALEAAKHCNELKEDPCRNYLYLDYKMRPLGSHSCGPEPEPEYELHPHSFRFSFLLAPEGYDEALALSHRDFAPVTCALSGAYDGSRIQKIPTLADCDL